MTKVRGFPGFMFLKTIFRSSSTLRLSIWRAKNVTSYRKSMLLPEKSARMTRSSGRARNRYNVCSYISFSVLII